MKLNIGSSCANGRYKEKEWVNLDLFKSKGVNVVGSGFCLPFEDNSFDEIHAIHVLEHLTRDKFPVMLKEMNRVLNNVGTCYIEVPNFEQIVKNLVTAYNKKDYERVHIWRTSIYGKTERPGMAHHFGFDTPTLTRYLSEAKFLHIVEEKEMISNHFKMEPVILMACKK